VLAYRAIAIWLPTPIAIASVPGLRATIARWGREDGFSLPAREPHSQLAVSHLASVAAH
jgi:hypothetical protein